MYVLTVCGMGFGTSLMLLMDLQDIAKEHNFKITGEAMDISSFKGKKADLIVASAEIAKTIESDGIPVIGIKNILDKKEIEEKLLLFIQNTNN
ncbi:MAG: PTS sugar transporter subunit IIB [Anaerolineaceae bacterium]|nr:PTS sugar transporter subunit IIB [Anaerolineaceae bacterium]